MSAIHIVWLSDSHDCESCGPTYAEGALVLIDGEEVINLEPVAHCFDGSDHRPEQVFTAILQHLGHSVTEDLEGVS